MNTKLILRFVLLGLVAVGIGRWAWKEFGQSAPVAAATVEARPDGVTVISLHGDKRCRTCIHIGDLAKEEIESAFPAELAANQLHWDMINYEKPENRQLVNHYELVSSTIVVSRWQDGVEVEWERLDEVWDLIGEEPTYRTFIDEKVKAMLEKS